MGKKYEGSKLQLWEPREQDVSEYFLTNGGTEGDIDTYLSEDNDYREILVVRTTEGEQIGYVDIFFTDKDRKSAYLSDILFCSKMLEKHYGKKTIKYVIRYLYYRDVLQVELNVRNSLLKQYQNSNGLESSVLGYKTIATV